MTASEYDSVRPPEPAGRRRRGGRGGRPAGADGARPGGADGAREAAMVPEAEFTSYYGRPVVKAAPWGPEIAAYLFLGGVAGGSAVLAAGAQLTGRHDAAPQLPAGRARRGQRRGGRPGATTSAGRSAS